MRHGGEERRERWREILKSLHTSRLPPFFKHVLMSFGTSFPSRGSHAVTPRQKQWCNHSCDLFPRSPYPSEPTPYEHLKRLCRAANTCRPRSIVGLIAMVSALPHNSKVLMTTSAAGQGSRMSLAAFDTTTRGPCVTVTSLPFWQA